ncbi:MAG: chromate transporter [Spirochaetia bacterium]|nr:chromate transporter [Spirochaetia bacterium]
MIELVLSFLKLGAVSYGGGWTIVGLIRTEVLRQGWLDEGAFRDLVAIAQVTPGPVALNAATLVGHKVGGLAGSALATLSVVTVPILASLALGALISRLGPRGNRFREALRSGTFGLLAMTVWAFAPEAARDPFAAGLALGAFGLAAFTKANPVLLILGAGALKLLASFVLA